MGSANAVSFGRGKRGIAGSLVLMNYNKDGLSDLYEGSSFYANLGEPGPRENSNAETAADYATEGFENPAADPRSDQVIATPWFADQLLPFELELFAANEYGSQSRMSIFGVELLNKGWGVSVDDMVSESQLTWIALFVHPWRVVADNRDLVGTGVPIITG